MLEAHGLAVSYGAGVAALDHVSVSLAAGERVALLGPNGAGKTTLVRAFAGALSLYGARITAGEVRIDGVGARMRRPAHGVRRGIAAIPEGRAIIGRLTVLENLLLGASALGSADAEQLSAVWDAFPVLHDRSAQSAGLLSGGEQQMLAIGRALMSRPTYLVADELSLGLAPRITDDILERLLVLSRERDMAVLLVEQNARRALQFADRAYVLVAGAITTQGSSSDLIATGDLARDYLGVET